MDSAISDELDPNWRMRRIQAANQKEPNKIIDLITLGDLQKECALRRPHWAETASDQDGGHEGALGVNLAQAVEMIAYGWVDMPYQVFSVPVIGNRQRLEADYGEEGEELDVSAYLSGDDRHWVDYKETGDLQQGGKILRVCSNVAANSGVKPESMAKRGIATMALIESLEAAGYNVELWAALHSGGTTDSSLEYRGAILVKTANDYINRARALFFLAHPATFRKLGFYLRERLPEKLCYRLGAHIHGSGGYGRTTNYPSKDWDIYIPAITYGNLDTFNDRAKSIAWVKEQVAPFIK